MEVFVSLLGLQMEDFLRPLVCNPSSFTSLYLVLFILFCFLGMDGRLAIWDIETGQCVGGLRGKDNATFSTHSLKFSAAT